MILIIVLISALAVAISAGTLVFNMLNSQLTRSNVQDW